jgi:hypothetical protein
MKEMQGITEAGSASAFRERKDIYFGGTHQMKLFNIILP